MYEFHTLALIYVNVMKWNLKSMLLELDLQLNIILMVDSSLFINHVFIYLLDVQASKC